MTVTAFCTEADVERISRVSITATTKPNSTQLAESIEDGAAEVRGWLEGLGITNTTVTEADTPISFQICKKINALLAASDLFMPLDKETPDRYGSKAKRMMTRVEENPMILSDIYSASASGGWASNYTNGTSGTDYDSSDPPFDATDESM